MINLRKETLRGSHITHNLNTFMVRSCVTLELLLNLSEAYLIYKINKMFRSLSLTERMLPIPQGICKFQSEDIRPLR